MKRRGSVRKPVLDLNSKSDSPVRQSWQTKYQQICLEHSQNGGSGESSPVAAVEAGAGAADDNSPKKRRLSDVTSNPLKGLLGHYNSDDDDDNNADEGSNQSESADRNGALDAKVEDFLKEIQEIAPLEKPKKKKKKKDPSAAAAVAAKVQPDASVQHATAAATSAVALMQQQQPTIAWQECYDEGTGYAYYWNMHTNEVTWQMPLEYQQYLLVLDAWQKQHMSAAAAPATTADASQQALQSKKKSETKASTKSKQLDKRKSKKTDNSDSEDEKIELITSYGQSSSDDTDSDEEGEEQKPSVAPSRPQLGLKRPFQELGDKRPPKWDSQKVPSVAATLKPKVHSASEITAPKSVLKKKDDKLSKVVDKSAVLNAEKLSVMPKVDEKSSSVLSKVDDKGSIIPNVVKKFPVLPNIVDKPSVISKVADKKLITDEQLLTESTVVATDIKVTDTVVAVKKSVTDTKITDKKPVTAFVGDENSLIDTILAANEKSSDGSSEIKQEPGSYDSTNSTSSGKPLVSDGAVRSDKRPVKSCDKSDALKKLKRLKQKAVNSDSSSSSSGESSSSASDDSNDGGSGKRDEDDVDSDDDIDEKDILARLRNQANILKELGGEVPDSIKALIADDAPSSFSLIAGYGDSDGEDDKEVEAKKEEDASEPPMAVTPAELKPLFPIMESVKEEADREEGSKEADGKKKKKEKEVVAASEEVEEKKQPPMIGRALDEARSAANRKVIKLSARAKALIENSVTTAKARATDFVQTDQGLKPGTKSGLPDDSKLKSQGQPPAAEDKSKRTAKAEPEAKKKSSKSKTPAVVASSSSTSLQPPSEPASSSKSADFGKAGGSGGVSSSLAYTSTWMYGAEQSSGERRGFGFSGGQQQLQQLQQDAAKTDKKTVNKKPAMIQFVRSDTVLNEPIVEKAPVISEEKKFLARTLLTVDPDTESTLRDLATVIREKTAFLSEGKQPISAVQVMSIQLEMLTNAWNEKALTSDYYNNWLGSVTRQLTSLEMAATPLNWACFWDRSHKRYYYRNSETGQVQWEYPTVAEEELVAAAAGSGETALVSAGEDAMELCTTPPPPPLPQDDDFVAAPNEPPPPGISSSPPPPPPPPPNISSLLEGGDSMERAAAKDISDDDSSQPQPPPPPMISDSFDLEDAASPPPPPLPPTAPPVDVTAYQGPALVAAPSAQYLAQHTTQYITPSTADYGTAAVPTAAAATSADPNLSFELSSFYSDIAALNPPPPSEPAPLPPLPPPDTAPLPPLPPPPTEAPPPLPPSDPPPPPPKTAASTKKKKKPKLGPGLSLKKRGYSSLMEKWQQLVEEEGEDSSD